MFFAQGKGFLNELFVYDCTGNFPSGYYMEYTLKRNICLQFAQAGYCVSFHEYVGWKCILFERALMSVSIIVHSTHTI